MCHRLLRLRVWLNAAAALLSISACTPAPAPRPASLPVASTTVRVQTPAQKPSGPRLALGKNHSCVLRNNGTVLCWGNNEFGQLGDGTHQSRSLPKPVLAAQGSSGLLNEVIALASGDYHVCAVRASGELYCWGEVRPSEFSCWDSIPFDAGSSTLPLHVSTSSAVAGVAARNERTCVWLRDGTVHCWENDLKKAPAPILEVENTAQVALGRFEICARDREGGVLCWSRTGEFRNVSVPGPVQTLVMTSSTSCVGLADQRTLCSRLSQNCSGATSAEPLEEAKELSGLAAVTGGEGSLCALSNFGRVECLPVPPIKHSWWKQSDERLFEPRSNADLPGAKELQLNHHHGCILLEDERIQCFGINESYEVGHDALTRGGDEAAEWELPNVCRVPIEGATDVAVGYGYSCALLKDGSVQCWGRNAGFWPPTVGWRSVRPRPVTALGTATAIVSEGTATCALAPEGTARCIFTEEMQWDGRPIHDVVPSPVVTVPDFSNIVELAIGGFHFGDGHDIWTASVGGRLCGRDRTGKVRCHWFPSSDEANELGLEEAEHVAWSRAKSVTVKERAAALSVGSREACILTPDGRVLCWGGSDRKRVSLRPVGIHGRLSQLTSGEEQGCVLSGGKLSCWNAPALFEGAADYDECASGTQKRPASVPELTSVKQMALSGEPCFVHTDGRVTCADRWCLGRCGCQELNTVDVSNASKVAVSLFHGCALTQDGHVRCWGSNEFGQCGQDLNSNAWVALDAGRQ